MSRGHQLGYAWGVCTHVWALRVVLVNGVDSARVPVLCRTNLHHHRCRYAHEANIASEICARCGKEKDPIEQTYVANAGLGIGLGFGNVH